MTKLAQRDANGIVTAYGGDASVQIKIPRDRSMLSILGSSTAGKICTGYEYREDGYVYLEDKRIKKWYVSVSTFGNDIQVWEPSLDDVVALEARYWRVKQAGMYWYINFHQPLVKKIYDAGGHAHAKILHSECDVPWYLYDVGYREPYGLCVGFNWCDRVPESPVNLDLGQEYYQLDCYSRSVGQRSWKFSRALMRAIDHYLAKRLPDKAGVILKLSINGRNYFYRSELGRGGFCSWEKLVWPPNEIVEIVL